jgi:hypothetical protein
MEESELRQNGVLQSSFAGRSLRPLGAANLINNLYTKITHLGDALDC